MTCQHGKSLWLLQPEQGGHLPCWARGSCWAGGCAYQGLCQTHLVCPQWDVSVCRSFLGMFAGKGDGWTVFKGNVSDILPASPVPGVSTEGLASLYGDGRERVCQDPAQHRPWARDAP